MIEKQIDEEISDNQTPESYLKVIKSYNIVLKEYEENITESIILLKELKKEMFK